MLTRRPSREQPATTVEKALQALEAGRAIAAFRALKRLAESGDQGAFHMLGYLYDLGEGTRRNRKRAMYWYLRSYGTGRAESANNIATIYRDAGRSRLEFEWYKRAAALGDGDACVEVAIRYLSGKGFVGVSVPPSVTSGPCQRLGIPARRRKTLLDSCSMGAP